MRRWQMMGVMVLALLMARSAAAQQNATTVQLPSFSFFTVSSTVSVPNRGATLLGGVKRASSGRNEFGVPILGKVPGLGRLGRNVSIGRETQSQNVWVTAYVHDFEAMEANLLRPQFRAARERRPAVAAFWKNTTADADRPIHSVAAIHQKRESQAQAQQREALAFFERAQTLAADGKTGVAKVYYRMAAKRATGELKSRILFQLSQVNAN